MTAPGGSFVAEIGADVSGLESELRAAIAIVQAFANDVNRTQQQIRPITIIPADIAAQAKQLGLAVGSPIIAEMAKVAAAIEAELAAAVGDTGRMASLGAADGAAFANALNGAVAQRVGGAGVQAAVNSLRVAVSSTRDIGTAAATSSRSFGLLNAETGRFGPVGNRAANAAVAIGFGLTQLAAGGSKAEGGLRQALRATAAFGAFLGPEGIIVAGAATATEAIITMFGRARDEMQQTVTSFNTELGQLLAGLDLNPVQAKLRKLQFGDPAGGDALGGAFVKGIVGIKKELEAANALVASHPVLGALIGAAPTSIIPETPFTKAARDAARLFDELKELERQSKKIKTDFLAIQSQQSSLGNQPPQTITVLGPIKAAAQELKDFEARVAAALSAEKQVADIAGLALPGLPALLTRLYDDATRRLTLLGDGMDAASVKMRGVIQELLKAPELVASLAARGDINLGDLGIAKSLQSVDFAANLKVAMDRDAPRIPELKIKTIVLPPDPGVIQGLDKQVQAVIDARGLVDISKLTGSSQFVGETTKQLKVAEDGLRHFAAQAAASLLEPGLSADDLSKRIAALAAAMHELPQKAGRDFGKIADNIHAIATGARGLLDIASSMGKIGDSAAESIGHVIALGDSIGTLIEGIAKGIATGGLAGIISGSVGALGAIAGLLGPSAADKEANDLVRKNNEALQRLGQDLHGFGDNLRSQQAVGHALQDPASRSLIDIALARGGKNGLADNDFINKQLQQFGISLADINRIAKDNGITLLDSQGRVVAGSLDALDKALGSVIFQSTHFANTLADQRSLADLTLNVKDVTDPQSIVKSWLTSIGDLFPKLFEQFFAGIAPTDTKGLKDAEKRFLAALTLDPDLLAKLGLTTADLLALFGGLETGLDGLAGAVNAATESMRNVPQWFKIEGFRFDAATALPVSPTQMPAPPPEPGITPSLGPKTPKPGSEGASNVTVNGGLNITIVDSKTPKETAQAVIGEIRKVGLATGDPVLQRWAVFLP